MFFSRNYNGLMILVYYNHMIMRTRVITMMQPTFGRRMRCRYSGARNSKETDTHCRFVGGLCGVASSQSIALFAYTSSFFSQVSAIPRR